MKQFYFLLFFVCLSHFLAAQECDGISGNITPAVSTICQGSSVTLTATGGSSYEWRLNGDLIENETGSTLNATSGGFYSVIIKEGECAVPASNVASVIVTPAPSGIIFPSSSTICTGSSTRLTATGGSSYTWFRDGIEINGENKSTLDADQAGTYSVLIHNGDCSVEALNTAEVTVNGNPQGNISPVSASFCQGSSVVLTASGGTSYTWFRNGNEINNRRGETLTVSQAGTYSVVIHQGDCSAEASNTSVITVTEAPSGNISPAFTSICAGGSTQLTATGGSSYTWFLNGNEIAGETGETLTVTRGGLYSATIHQGECSGPASNSSLVSVNAVPDGNITPASRSICEGESVTLRASGGSSYTWFKDGVEITGETGAQLSVSEAGEYSAIISQGTCSGPASNTSSITIAPPPSGSISPASGAICPGGTITLTATGGSSYIWYRNGNVIRGQDEATLTVRQPGTYTATIEQGRCNAPASNTVEIVTASAPSGEITPAKASFCEGGAALLSVTGGSSYQWFRNGVLIQGETGSTFTATKPGTYTATISQGECNGPASNSAVVTLNNKPSGNITPASGIICNNSPITLTAAGGTSYQWLRDDVIIDGQQSATLSATEAGTYSVIIQNGSCEGPASNTATLTSESVQGIHYPTIGALPGNPVQLEARNIGVSYEWTPPAGLSNPLSRTPTLTASEELEYIVKITTQSGCVVNDSVLVKIRTSIFIPTGFTPDGNGVNDKLKPMGALKTIGAFKVFNRWGQLMYQTSQMNSGWDGTFNGKPQPSDAYTWILIATGMDGKPIKLTGKSLLIR